MPPKASSASCACSAASRLHACRSALRRASTVSVACPASYAHPLRSARGRPSPPNPDVAIRSLSRTRYGLLRLANEMSSKAHERSPRAHELHARHRQWETPCWLRLGSFRPRTQHGLVNASLLPRPPLERGAPSARLHIGLPNTGAASTGRCNSPAKHLGWCHPIQRLSRAIVELPGDGVEVSGAV